MGAKGLVREPEKDASEMSVCPVCGARDVTTWIDGDVNHEMTHVYYCYTCLNTFTPEVMRQMAAEYMQLGGSVNYRRVVNAVLWLRANWKRPVTRLEVARHMRVSKSPHFIHAMKEAVVRGEIKAYIDEHPLTGRDCWFYTRPDAVQGE